MHINYYFWNLINEGVLNEHDFDNEYDEFSRKDALGERERIKELYKKGFLEEEEYLARVTPLQELF